MYKDDWQPGAVDTGTDHSTKRGEVFTSRPLSKDRNSVTVVLYRAITKSKRAGRFGDRGQSVRCQ